MPEGRPQDYGLTPYFEVFARPSESEKTITVEIDGRFFNVPTIESRTRRRMRPDEAIRQAIALRLLGEGFDSLDEAVASAGLRSEMLGLGLLTNPNRAMLMDGNLSPRLRAPFNPGGRIR